jgi:glycosyltransferase involved in cell wall biosynthesis
VKILLLLSLAGILYTYAGYPAMVWLLSRFRPQPWKTEPILPGISIVMAVHNGIAMLPEKIRHLLELDYPNIEQIIVISDGSTDGTAEMIASRHSLRLLPIVLEEHGGKAAAVNAGLKVATGELILFVDIRPQIAPGAIQHLVGNFADPKVGCAAGILTLRQDGHDGAAGAVGGIYWRYEQWLRICESIVDSPTGVYGGFYAIRRNLATRIPPGIILDDMFQPLSIIRQGYRSVLDPKAHVYDIWPKKAGGEFHRKVRTLAGNFQLFQMAPWTLTSQNRVLFQLISHKLMRLLVPYLMMLLLVSSMALATASPIYAALAVAQIGFWAVAIAGLGNRIPVLHRMAAPASALLVLNAAAVAGLYAFVTTRGPLWKIWTRNPPANSDKVVERTT